MAGFLPITRTKILLPRRRAELLARPRLLALLEELLDYRMMIIAAPAGYGKTSLLVDFASSTEWPVCWYALDGLDQDAFRFVAHFISAIAQRFPAFGKSALAALESMGQDHMDLDMLSSLISNEAYETITEHFLLVLDDYHLVEASQPVAHFINRFIQEVDENCHLVLTSRTLLTLPDLPLMVARAQVGGLSFEDLIFQPEEIRLLLQQNYQLSITAAEAGVLAQESEGWVTGLLLSTQLMGKTIANRQRVARVSGIGLYEYLTQQVLAQQTPDVRAFLLRTSLLDEVDEHTCEEVIGVALGQHFPWRDLMDSVMRHNLFVLPVGEDGTSLRYHHLFVDFLRDRVRRELPEEARQITLRLAEVYISRDEWERAYDLYQMMGDTAAIVRMVEQAGASMIGRGRLLTLAEWLERLPEDLLQKHPSLVSLQGTVAVTRGDATTGLRLLNQAVTGLHRKGSLLELTQSLCRRSTAFRMTGQFKDAMQDADAAIRLIENAPQHEVTPELRLVHADALLCKGIGLSTQGQVNEGLDLLRQAMAAYEALGDDSTAAKVWIEIGCIYKTLGAYDQAEIAYQRALEYYQSTANLTWQANLYNNLGVLQHTRDDPLAATASFEKAIHYARLGGSPRLEAYAITSIGDLYQELDALQEAQEAYSQARVIAQQIQEGFLQMYLNLMEARLRLVQADLARAHTLVQEAQALAEMRGSHYEQNQCLLARGWVLLLSENRAQLSEAEHAIQTANTFFAQQGYEVELPRARLLALLAAVHTGALEQVESLQAQLEALLETPETLRQLIATGREARRLLEQHAANPFLRRLTSLIDQHEIELAGQRRAIRRHAVIVPFAPPKMIIQALGKPLVRISDSALTSSDWQVQTARDLFFLLLAHPEGLTKEQIGMIFWPDSTSSELKLRFKNTIYRLRHAAGKDSILFQGESLYLFNRNADYEYDVEIFLKALEGVKRSTSKADQEASLRAALAAYGGTYLPDVDASWAEIERERLRQMYLQALFRLAELRFTDKDYAETLRLSQQALKEDVCLEEAYRLSMKVYAAQGNRALVIRQYEQCKLTLREEVGAPPSDQTTALYHTLVH